jgi:hypothetical protein
VLDADWAKCRALVRKEESHGVLDAVALTALDILKDFIVNHEYVPCCQLAFERFAWR